MPLTDNLISFWELEEASGTRVDAVTATGNDLTDNNTVTQNPGIVGQAAQFTSANSESLTHADNASLQCGNIDQTFCLWVYLDSKPAGFPSPLVKSASGGYLLYHDTSADRFTFELRNSAGSQVMQVTDNNFGSAPLTTALFLVCWFDSVAGTGFISVNDGTANSAAKTGTPAAGTGVFELGGEASIYWNGRIDQVGLWKRVLTAAERTFLYNGGNGRSYAAIVAQGVTTRALLAMRVPVTA